MSPFDIIPAIDLLNGRVVRLFQGDYNRATIYPVDPVELARQFLEGGLTRVHVVDLEGARSGSPTELATVAKIAATGINIELGGGIRSEQNIQQAIDAGASEVILGTSLLANQSQLEDWLNRYSGTLVAGVDSSNGQVAVSGWHESTDIDSIELLIKLDQLGFHRAIVTDIATDGTLVGPNLPYLSRTAEATSMAITASGGIANIDHLQSVAQLAPLGISGVIVGRAYYEGAISIAQMARC